jgi:hypothetical protein
MRQDAGAINVVVPRFLTAGGTGAAVAAQVLGPDGGSVPDGTAVTFSATLGLRLEPVSARTMNGVATVVAVPGTEAGFARIDASAGSDRGTAVLWVRPGPAAEVVSVEAQPAGIAPGAMSLVTAAVNDAWGNAAEGDTVRWSADLGSVDDAETRLDAGRTAVWFTSDGTEGVAHVALQAGEARGEAYIPVDRLWAERNHVVFLPRALSDAARTCEDLLVNSDFGADRDADGVPDNWRLEPGAEALTPISAEGLGRGEAIRLALSDDGAPVRLYQDRTAPADLVRGTLRLWLKGSAGAHLRAAVWSMVDVAGNPTRLPLIVENIATADAWTLQVLPLPVPPVGATTVELSPRGAAGDHVDIARSSLEVCR